jgi:SAM-dependent methyltransferase
MSESSEPNSTGTGQSYFEQLYRADADPWGFDSRWYEERKFALSTAILPNERYRRCAEPGCSNGALTERLAPRCDELIAYDFIQTTVGVAQSRLAVHPHVEVRCERFPVYWPDGTGDLVVWSEVAYYLNETGAELALDGLRDWLEPDGHLLAVHYSGTTDYPRSGAEVEAWLDDVSWLRRTVTHADVGFTAGVWRRSAD